MTPGSAESSRDVTERVLTFDCSGVCMAGILSVPVVAAELGVVIVVGGPQYRAGSHRQFVLLARALCAAGFAVLRFDCRGMGDSAGALRTFEQMNDDIGAAISALLSAVPALRRVALWGLCDGASAALLYQHALGDDRVVGQALLNPWVRSEASLAKTHVKHYYRQRLAEPAFWRKLVNGKVAFSALTGLVANLRAAISDRAAPVSAEAPYQQRMALAWRASDRTLLMLSECDLTAREFVEFTAADPAWQHAMEQRPAFRVTVADADHTCSTPAAQRAVEAATVQWLANTLAR